MTMRIEISSQHARFTLDQEAASLLVSQVSRDETLSAQSISIILVDDAYLRKLHKDYLNDDSNTDVMTFNLGSVESVEGEIYISAERAAEHAKRYNASHSNELARLIIHGILHLNGHDDLQAGERTRMRGLESHYLERYKEIAELLLGNS